MDEAPQGQQPSFAERKAAQLAQERAAREPETNVPPPAEAPEGTPEALVESAGDGYPEEELPGVESELDEDEYDDEAPEGTPESEVDPDQEADSTDWKQRFEDAQRKISEVTENRSAMEQEHADMMSANLTLRHNLEDKFTEARLYTEQITSAMDNQIMQLEHAFTNGMIEPENLPQARQQHQVLINQRNGLNQRIEEIKAKEAEAQAIDRDRKAEVARMRLSRTIPGWSREKHQELGSYALSRGYSAEEFNENLDYRFLELLHDSMQLNTASRTVKNVKRQRKAGQPARNARPQPRSADGKYRKAKQDFHENPNQRGRFAAMKLAEMRKERR